MPRIISAVGPAMRQTILVQFELTEICYVLGPTFLLSQDFSDESVDEEAPGVPAATMGGLALSGTVTYINRRLWTSC